MTPEEYLKRPYHWCFVPLFSGSQFNGYYVCIKEFPGCLAEGDTLDEAWDNLHDAALDWIAAALDLGQEIPEPEEKI